MRSFISFLLTVLGAACLYLFAVAPRPGDGGPEALLERASKPFQAWTPFTGGCLAAAAAALVIAQGLRRGPFRLEPHSRGKAVWGRAFQCALLCDVALVAVIIFLLLLPATGWLKSFQPAPAALGALFLAGLLEAAVGTVLVIGLFFLEKKKLLFVSTVLAHVVELGLLGLIFSLGSRV